MTLCPLCELVGISDKYELKLSPSTGTIIISTKCCTSTATTCTSAQAMKKSDKFSRTTCNAVPSQECGGTRASACCNNLSTSRTNGSGTVTIAYKEGIGTELVSFVRYAAKHKC